MINYRILTTGLLIIVPGFVMAQEPKDSIHFELRPDALDAIRKAFGEPLKAKTKPTFDFIRKIPGLTTDSTDIRKVLTLRPYNFNTRFDEDPIYDKMSKEVKMAAGIGLAKYNYKFPTIKNPKGHDFNAFLNMIFSPQERRKKKNRMFIEKVLLPAFDKESIKFYEKNDLKK